MTIDINRFWTLLSESQLVNAAQTQSLFTKFSADSSLPKQADSLANWLVKQKAISPYQASILAAGHSGPFRYGNYTVVEQIENGPLAGHFQARHAKTGHPVLLLFFPGEKTDDLKRWNIIEALVERTSPIQHPNLTESFDSLVLSNRRFVVAQTPVGSALAQKLPSKTRLPWKKACAIMAQVANGLDRLHQSGIVHNAVSPRTIWVNKNGMAQIFYSPIPEVESAPNLESEYKFDYSAPENFDVRTAESLLDLESRQKNSAAYSSDLYSFGCTLYRMIAGRVLFAEPDPAKKKELHNTQAIPSLSKYELPQELESLLEKLLGKKPSDRPQSAGDVGKLLGLLSGKAEEISSLKIPKSKTRMAFRRSLTEFLPTEKTETAAPSIEEEEPEIVTPELLESRQAKIKAATDAALRRKSGKWKMPVAVAAGLLALSSVVGLFALSANKKVVNNLDQPDSVVKNSQPIESEQPVGENQGGLNLAEIPPSERPILIQELIVDDDKSLWESPTSGAPIELAFLPPAPKIVVVIRPSELGSDEEGARVLASLGPAFSNRLKSFETELGFPLELIDQLVVSFHTNKDFEYEPFFVVQTNKPMDRESMLQAWNRPTKRSINSTVDTDQQSVLDSADGKSSYFIISDGNKSVELENSVDGEPDTESGNPTTESAPVKATRFAYGAKNLIDEVAVSFGATVMPKSLAKLAHSSDRQRHLNILFLRNSLFNEEGQKLMGLDNLALNRELSIMIPDDVRGGLLSLHLDSGTYVELMFDKNVDLKAGDLKSMMIEAFRNRRDMLMSFVAKIPASEYWDNVRIRYGGMLADFYRNIRWDVEHGEVVANCWLPPMAAHNLIAASEHVISYSSGTSSSTATVATGPQTLEELLAAKRDLNIANPPDLNVLLANIQSEISDDYPKLPFAFNIRLIGGDLEKEGITKNQRPSELVMNQKSLAEILTSIMTSANPSKDISGPSDPNCKLIWVVADDPQIPGEKAILVTTRVAAAEKSYKIPPAFSAE